MRQITFRWNFTITKCFFQRLFFSWNCRLLIGFMKRRIDHHVMSSNSEWKFYVYILFHVNGTSPTYANLKNIFYNLKYLHSKVERHYRRTSLLNTTNSNQSIKFWFFFYKIYFEIRVFIRPKIVRQIRQLTVFSNLEIISDVS